MALVLFDTPVDAGNAATRAYAGRVSEAARKKGLTVRRLLKDEVAKGIGTETQGVIVKDGKIIGVGSLSELGAYFEVKVKPGDVTEYQPTDPTRGKKKSDETSAPAASEHEHATAEDAAFA